MSKRQKPVSEVDAVSGVDVQVTRVTRSGRISRPPPSRAESETPKRGTRRTRKSAVQEPTVVEEKPVEETPGSLLGGEPDVSPTAGLCPVSEAGAGVTPDLNGALGLCGTAPTETAPTSVESVPKKKPPVAPSGAQKTVIPLGKPKSGRVWKDRNKKRSGNDHGPCYCP